MSQTLQAEAQRLASLEYDCVKLRESALLKQTSPKAMRQRALQRLMKKHFEEVDAFERVEIEAARLKSARVEPVDLFQPLLPRAANGFNNLPEATRQIIQSLPPVLREQAMAQMQNILNRQQPTPTPSQTEDDWPYQDPEDVYGEDDDDNGDLPISDQEDDPSNPSTVSLGTPSQSDSNSDFYDQGDLLGGRRGGPGAL